MVMETERLLLREYTPEDFDALYEILSDPETMRHYPAPPTLLPLPGKNGKTGDNRLRIFPSGSVHPDGDQSAL